MIYNIVVLFLLIFSFPIPGIGNSFYLAVGISFLSLFYHRRFPLLYHYFCSRYVVWLIISTILLITYAFVFPILIGTYDYSRALALVSLLVGIFSVIIVYSSLTIDKRNYDSIGKLLVLVFVVQSIISLAGFISSDVKHVVEIFQFQEDAEIAQEAYAGIRGLAISGRLYFEFAATCGLMVIIQMKRMLDSGLYTYTMLLEFLLLIICGFFAGRTSLSGIGFSLVLILCYQAKFYNKLNLFVKLFVCLFVFVLLCVAILPDVLLDFINTSLLPWVFDLFIKFAETGDTESSYSFNMLNDMYGTVQITLQEWIVGAGRYVNIDGTYYKNVDAGYLRQLLFWGIIGSVCNLIYSIQFFKYPWQCNKGKNDHCFLMVIFLYTLLLHYKGDIMGISRFYYVVLSLYLFHMFFCIHRPQVKNIF